MSKELSRGAAIGLLFSAVVLGAIYWYGPTLFATEEDVAESQTAENQKGQVDLETELADKENKINELNQELAEIESAKSEAADSESEPEAIHHAVFEVETGESVQEVGQRLEKKNILEDGDSFHKAVTEKNLENELQTGSFTLNSTMSTSTIVNKITS